MKRFFDIFLSVILIIILLPLYFVVSILIKFTSSGPIFYWSKRVGRHGNFFYMPKFRTMMIGAPEVATHLLVEPNNYLTALGAFLRKTSIDELPQLWSILIGDMSFVGPRPALFNQYDLIELRRQKGIDKLLPGLTGLAQIKGRDDLLVTHKVQYEVEYLRSQSFWLDLRILGLTFIVVIRGGGVAH